jgi:hypothetical protein
MTLENLKKRLREENRLFDKYGDAIDRIEEQAEYLRKHHLYDAKYHRDYPMLQKREVRIVNLRSDHHYNIQKLQQRINFEETRATDPHAIRQKELRAKIRELEKENKKYADGLHRLNQEPNPKSDLITRMHVSDIIGDNYRSILHYKNELKQIKKKR